MVPSWRSVVASFGLLPLLVPALAHAADGYDGLYFKPQMFTRGGVVTEGASTPGYLDVDAALMLDFMGPSLKLRSKDGSEREIVGSALTLNAMSAVGLWYGTEVGIAVPVVPVRAVDSASNLNGAAIGDISLNLKYRIIGAAPGDFMLAAGPVLYFPTGNYEQLTGTGNFSFALLAAAEKAFGPLNVIANVGFRYMDTGKFLTAKTGAQIPIRAAVEYAVLPGSLSVLTELNSAVGIEGDFPAEWNIAEVKWLYGPLALIGGAGMGLSSALAIPPWRAFVGAAWTFKNTDGGSVPSPTAGQMEPPKWATEGAPAVPPATSPAPAPVPPAAPVVPPAAPAAPPPAPAPAPVPPPPAAKPLDDSLPVMGIPDRDKDGVPDEKDDCPEAAGPEFNKGCPVKFEGNKLLSFNAIVFGRHNAEILPESFKVLDAVVAALKASPKVKVRVEAHTDSSGDAGKNLMLSQQRALGVMNYLIAKGIEPARISYIGFGGSQPISALKSEEGRRQNRRVDFRVME